MKSATSNVILTHGSDGEMWYREKITRFFHRDPLVVTAQINYLVRRRNTCGKMCNNGIMICNCNGIFLIWIYQKFYVNMLYNKHYVKIHAMFRNVNSDDIMSALFHDYNFQSPTITYYSILVGGNRAQFVGYSNISSPSGSNVNTGFPFQLKMLLIKKKQFFKTDTEDNCG